MVTGQAAAGRVLTDFCYQPGYHPRTWSPGTRTGGLTTVTESWTIPADALLLQPGETYELRVQYTARLKAPDGTVTEPLGAGALAKARFRAGDPPAYTGALASFVADTWPADGARPVYTGYDVTVRFVEEYVPYLYAAVGEALVVRLFDAAGEPVKDADGSELLVPASDVAPVITTTTQEFWAEERNESADDDGCVDPVALPELGRTLLRLGGLALSPDSQYTAWLVSDGAPELPLLAWGFTTSRYAAFTALATRDRAVLAPKLLPGALAGTDFDALARAAGVPTIAYADRFTATPLVDAAGACLALLLEAPEPLGFGGRLTVEAGGVASTAVANADATRAFVLAPGAGWTDDPLSVRLAWLRDAGEALPVFAVDGDTAAESVSFDVPLGGGA
ncbi:MAG TPA: hypothetical protein VHG91_18940 [Longimicrobium sp.]|nr:hypothetical protein [Longimicrobium sp.]